MTAELAWEPRTDWAETMEKAAADLTKARREVVSIMKIIMSFRAVFVVMALGLGGMGLRADQIEMKNGDRVTGSIVKKDAKTLTIKTVHFGVVTLPWDQVASVTADKPLYVVLADGKTVQGSLATADGQVVVATGGTKQTVAPGEIAVLRDDAGERDAGDESR